MNKLHLLIARQEVEDVHRQEVTTRSSPTVLGGFRTLEFDWHHEGDAIQYKHVYQHNQSDLEFLRMRAARIGAHIWCVGRRSSSSGPSFRTTRASSSRSIKATAGESPRVKSSRDG